MRHLGRPPASNVAIDHPRACLSLIVAIAPPNPRPVLAEKCRADRAEIPEIGLGAVAPGVGLFRAGRGLSELSTSRVRVSYSVNHR